MACVQLTEDVIEIVVETIDREIHRLTKARAGLLELRQRYDHEPPERDAAPIAVSDQEATPAMKTARKPRVVKKASSGKSKARFIAAGGPMWHEVQFTPWARWFAPCRRISPCGIVLIQERTRPLPHGELPKELPDFFTDLKPENFGLIDGQVVCHDYALHLASSNWLGKAKMKKVKKDEWRLPDED